ncbi:SDR family NAD(P)-dependent oxidoreductase [Sorangium sp. So ce185]|uniref:SDR family NAD(P)-dependent oxidoreductase n=1 Tax=Sorangium sp. So ce185 TaxID=3133287 RepID=UPI003F5E36B8
MTNKQHPIGSGFSAASTADDVLRGIDLSGKNVIVTGGHAGLGLETTRALAKAGASVTVGARDPGRAASAVAGIERVEVSQLDLIDPKSIDGFAERWLASDRPLHVLINCAAPPAPKEIARDARGYAAPGPPLRHGAAMGDCPAGARSRTTSRCALRPFPLRARRADRCSSTLSQRPRGGHRTGRAPSCAPRRSVTPYSVSRRASRARPTPGRTRVPSARRCAPVARSAPPGPRSFDPGPSHHDARGPTLSVYCVTLLRAALRLLLPTRPASFTYAPNDTVAAGMVTRQF